MKTSGYYRDLYLTTDVFMFVEIVEEFRCVCLEYSGLDACHNLSSPRLGCDGALKMTDAKLDLISDICINLLKSHKGMRKFITKA